MTYAYYVLVPFRICALYRLSSEIYSLVESEICKVDREWLKSISVCCVNLIAVLLAEELKIIQPRKQVMYFIRVSNDHGHDHNSKLEL